MAGSTSQTDAAPADTAAGAGVAEQQHFKRPKPGSLVGKWRVQGVLGEGKTLAVVYHAIPESFDENSTEPREVALKFPVRQREVECLSRVQQVPGVPNILDSGQVFRDSFFAMPVLSVSLEALLQQLDHDGLGGRLSCEAVKSLGCMLLQTIQEIHANGVVHCDLKPGNILLPKSGSHPHIIDFGRSHLMEFPPADDGVAGGALEYNSIRAGRDEVCVTPINDLECLGWVLLRCVLGHLPWRKSIIEFKRADVPRKDFAKVISQAKELYLDSGCKLQGWRYNYCAQELREYFRYIDAVRDDPNAEPDYYRLMSLLQTDRADWDHVVRRFVRMGPDFEPSVVSAVQGQIVWSGGDTIHSDEVPKNARIRVTEREGEDESGRWLEVEGVWAPGLPSQLLERIWLLVANDDGILLEFESTREKPARPRQPCEDAEYFVIGSWDDWSQFAPLMPWHNSHEPDSEPREFYASVAVPDDHDSVEFQVVQDRDWGRRFYPVVFRDSDVVEIIGPVDMHGRNWEVLTPQGNGKHLSMTWNPCGRRTLNASFSKSRDSNAVQAELHMEPHDKEFFLIGSWDDWKQFVQLMPVLGKSHQFFASVPIQENISSVELQVIQDRNWKRRFYPSIVGTSNKVEIVGPVDMHGQNWEVAIPRGGGHFCVTWNSGGTRTLTAGLLKNIDGKVETETLYLQPCDKREFFLVGSWDNWQELVQLVPSHRTVPRHFHASVPIWTRIECVEFQVIQDRNREQCFYPSTVEDCDGVDILGPAETPGRNWKRSKPLGKLRHLCVTWNPYGMRTLNATFAKLR